MFKVDIWASLMNDGNPHEPSYTLFGKVLLKIGDKNKSNKDVLNCYSFSDLQARMF